MTTFSPEQFTRAPNAPSTQRLEKNFPQACARPLSFYSLSYFFRKEIGCIGCGGKAPRITPDPATNNPKFLLGSLGVWLGRSGRLPSFKAYARPWKTPPALHSDEYVRARDPSGISISTALPEKSHRRRLR